MDELLEDWRMSLRARGRSLATIQSYLAVGASFAAYLDEAGAAKTVDTIARGQIEAYPAGMREPGLSPATVAKHYPSLQQLFVWLLLEEGEISASPVQRMKSPTVPEQPVPVLCWPRLSGCASWRSTGRGPARSRARSRRATQRAAERENR